jgi:CRISPR system Cascade subunit CasA
LSIGGCVEYAPQPIDPTLFAPQFEVRALDLAAADEMLAQIAPDSAPSDAGWDIVRLYAAALRSNPHVVETRAVWESAAAAARSSQTAPVGTVTLLTEYSDEADGTSPWLLGFSSDLSIDAGARRDARVSAANATSVVARYDYIDACWAIRMSLRRALTERAFVQRESALLEELTALRNRQVDANVRRIDSGEGDRMELARARSQLAVDRHRLDDARARGVAASHSLAAAVGVPAAALQTVEVIDVAVPREAPDLDVRALRDAALLARADVSKAVVGYGDAEVALRAEVAKQYPEIRLGPGYIWERGVTKLPFDLSLVLPPLDRNRGAIATAESHRVEAGLRLERVQAEAYAAIDGAAADWATSRAVLESVRGREVPAAQAIATQADDALRVGAIDRIEWAQARSGLLEASLNELTAAHRVEDALLALEDALRRPVAGDELRIVRFAPDAAP